MLPRPKISPVNLQNVSIKWHGVTEMHVVLILPGGLSSEWGLADAAIVPPWWSYIVVIFKVPTASHPQSRLITPFLHINRWYIMPLWWHVSFCYASLLPLSLRRSAHWMLISILPWLCKLLGLCLLYSILQATSCNWYFPLSCLRFWTLHHYPTLARTVGRRFWRGQFSFPIVHCCIGLKLLEDPTSCFGLPAAVKSLHAP